MNRARAVLDGVALLRAARRSFAVGLVLLGLVAGRVAARQQAPTPATPATAAISGVVIDGVTRKPIAGAMVTFMLNDGPSSNLHSMLTDPQGRFVFLRLPPSSDCEVFVSKTGYAKSGFTRGGGGLGPGSNDPDRWTQAAIALKPGEWLSNVTLTMWRHGGISGRVVDEANEPVVGIPVRALRVILAAGVPHVAPGPIGTTDDRGMYRIASLPAGQYLVMMPSVQSSAPASTSANTLAGRRPDAEPTQQPLINGLGLNMGGDRLVIGNYVSPPPAGDRLLAYPTVFYPGARLLTGATAIDLGPGDEKGGVDFAIQPVPAVRVSGTVISAGALDPNLMLRLVPRGSENLGVGAEQATALVSASGAFTFLGVPSGSYTIDAGLNVTQFSSGGFLPRTPGMLRVVYGGAPAPSLTDGVGLWMMRKDIIEREWAELPLDVGADDVTGLRITLRPSITVSGEIVWDGPPGTYTNRATGQTYPALPSVMIEPADGDPRLFPTHTGLGGPAATQQFSRTGLRAGEYVIRPLAEHGTTIVRIVANGQDVTTGTIDTSSGDISGVVVTMTTRATTISGNVRDATEPARPTSVIAFPVEKRQWSRYGFTPLTIAAATFLGQRYTLTGLPPGEYFVIAVDAASGGAWRDPAWLEAASQLATRVTLKWDQPVTVDLSLSRVQVK